MTNPTRAEMARVIAACYDDAWTSTPEARASQQRIHNIHQAAAAHLRQSCETCQHVVRHGVHAPFLTCARWKHSIVPDDGTGYCHEYKEKS